MKTRIFLAILIFLGLSSFLTQSIAADAYLEKYMLHIDGEIREGDAERIATLLTDPRSILGININSPGGNLVEAMRIAELVERTYLALRVKHGGYCVSACFFIYIAGYSRRAESPFLSNGNWMPEDVRKQIDGSVGVHRPYLKSPTGDATSLQRQEDIMRQVRAYLSTKSIPQHLIDEMMARPSNDIYWLKKRDLDMLGTHQPSVEEALIAKCDYQRISTQVEERWASARLKKLWDCEFDYWDDMYRSPSKAYRDKLRTGWRPWVNKK